MKHHVVRTQRVGTRAVPAPGQPCTARTLRCPNARDYNAELNPCCRAHLRALMIVVAEILTDARATWWADYGTLLGAVRNPMTKWADYPWLRQDGRVSAGPAPGIVPHDKDGDLGILYRDFDGVRRRMRGLTARGMNVHVNIHRASMKVRVSSRNHTNIDLFFWRSREDVLFRQRYAQVDRFKGKEFPRAMLTPPGTVTWEGLTLPAPADPEAFLEFRYGPRWRTPLPANNDGVKR